MRVSIVVPAKNEERTIKKFVTALANAFKNGEIIVVCNGCTDNTYAVVKSIKKKNIKAMNFGNIGKGSAVNEGFKVAKNPIVGFVDSDGSFGIENIKKVLTGFNGYDVSIASKWKGRNFFSVKSSFSRKIASKVWNLLVRILFGLDIDDTQAGLKFFKKYAYDSVKRGLTCSGFEFDVEWLYKAKKKGYKIREVFVSHKEAKKTTLNPFHPIPMFFNLIKLRLSS